MSTETQPSGEDDLTVAIISADLRRRRRKQRWRRWRPLVLIALAVLLSALGVYAVWFSSWVTVRDVEISGNTTLSAVRLERVAAAPVGRPLARADLGAIRARIEALPAVKSAAVSRSWPHTIHIDVTERTAVAVVNRGNGLQGVDADGVLFGSYPTQPADLPLMVTDPDVQADALAEGAEVLASLRSDIAKRVKYINVQSIDNMALQMNDRRQVTWGSAANSAQKAEVLAVLLDRKGISKIDVSVPGQPTTR